MKRIREFGYVFTFEIHKAVYIFDFAKKHSVGFAESYRADKILVFKCIHISRSIDRSLFLVIVTQK